MNGDSRISYTWASRLAVLVGIVCMGIAVVTGVAGWTLITDPHYYIQVAIAAFVFAIWTRLH